MLTNDVVQESIRCSRAAAPAVGSQPAAEHNSVAPSTVLEACCGEGVDNEIAIETSPKPQIDARHLEVALRVTRPSVSKGDRVLYERLRDRLLSIRSNIAVSAAAAGAVATGSDAHASAGEGQLNGATNNNRGVGAAVPTQGGFNSGPGDDAMQGDS